MMLAARTCPLSGRQRRALLTTMARRAPQTVAEIANLKGPDREQILVDGAKKEGKVVIYSAMIEDQALRPITQAFHQKYPFIEAEFWRADTRDLINKTLAEARARAVVGDIVEGGGVSQALIKAGVAAELLDAGARALCQGTLRPRRDFGPRPA